MRVFFTVQGEGRGHLTQALALHHLLARHGHQVVGVVAGDNRVRTLPDYFTAAFDVPVHTLPSPGFAYKNARGVSWPGTLWDLWCGLPRYRHSLLRLRGLLRECRPDVVVNFLEPLMGLHNLLFGPAAPTLVVGHQYLFEHPAFPRVEAYPFEQRCLRIWLRLVGARSARLALSFYPATALPRQRLTVCPPLLRPRLFELVPFPGDHLLIYLLNHGYAEAIRRWHAMHREIPIHCFYDRPGAPAEECVNGRLTFHRPDGEKFLRLMAGCRAVACTAGFETLCEAAWLRKPILFVPVEQHVEQFLNACDAERAGLGRRDASFQLSRLLEPDFPVAGPHYRDWVRQAGSIALGAIEACAAGRGEVVSLLTPATGAAHF